MAVEINGAPVDMKDFYADIKVPEGVTSVVFRRFNFHPFRKIVSSLDRGEGQNPQHTAHAVVKMSDTSGIAIPLHFQGITNLEGSDAAMQDVHVFRNKVINGRGATAVEVYSDDQFTIKGAGTPLKVNNPMGIQIYKALMAHPYNKKNAERYNTREPLFELVEVEKERKAINDQTRNRNRIIALAFNETEVPDTLAIELHKEVGPLIGATQTSALVAAANWETLRGDLAQYASAYPDKFEQLVTDSNMGTRALIKDGLKLGIITMDKTRWYWGNIKKVKNKKDFCVIATGQDATQELLNHFLTRMGKKDLELLEEELEATKNT